MMTFPKIAHQRIAQNLARLLDDAIDALGLSLFVVRTPSVDLGLGSTVTSSSGKASTYVPEPDVAVIVYSRDPDRRIVDAAVVLVAIASSTDEIVTCDGRPWVDVKAALYRMHVHCQAVLVIKQERTRVRLWVRSGEDWRESLLTDPSDSLRIPCCGLTCEVGELYAKTHLAASEVLRPNSWGVSIISIARGLGEGRRPASACKMVAPRQPCRTVSLSDRRGYHVESDPRRQLDQHAGYQK